MYDALFAHISGEVDDLNSVYLLAIISSLDKNDVYPLSLVLEKVINGDIRPVGWRNNVEVGIRMLTGAIQEFTESASSDQKVLVGDLFGKFISQNIENLIPLAEQNLQQVVVSLIIVCLRTTAYQLSIQDTLKILEIISESPLQISKIAVMQEYCRKNLLPPSEKDLELEIEAIKSLTSTVPPQVTISNDSNWTFQGNSLLIQPRSGTKSLSIDFLPFGLRDHHEVSEKINRWALLAGASDMMELLRFLDNNPLIDRSITISNPTNPQMARLAGRVGFYRVNSREAMIEAFRINSGKGLGSVDLLLSTLMECISIRISEKITLGELYRVLVNNKERIEKLHELHLRTAANLRKTYPTIAFPLDLEGEV